MLARTMAEGGAAAVNAVVASVKSMEVIHRGRFKRAHPYHPPGAHPQKPLAAPLGPQVVTGTGARSGESQAGGSGSFLDTSTVHYVSSEEEGWVEGEEGEEGEGGGSGPPTRGIRRPGATSGRISGSTGMGAPQDRFDSVDSMQQAIVHALQGGQESRPGRSAAEETPPVYDSNTFLDQSTYYLAYAKAAGERKAGAREQQEQAVGRAQAKSLALEGEIAQLREVAVAAERKAESADLLSTATAESFRREAMLMCEQQKQDRDAAAAAAAAAAGTGLPLAAAVTVGDLRGDLDRLNSVMDEFATLEERYLGTDVDPLTTANMVALEGELIEELAGRTPPSVEEVLADLGARLQTAGADVQDVFERWEGGDRLVFRDDADDGDRDGAPDAGSFRVTCLTVPRCSSSAL